MAGSFRDLRVYKKAFELAVKVFEITKKFPSEKKYDLTGQIRRSSRAVCRAIEYPKHFSGKMSYADMENTETQVSLDLAATCKNISQEEYQCLLNNSEEIGRMLNHMVENPEK